MQAWLTMQALTEFVYLEFVGVRSFRAIQRVVVRTPVRKKGSPEPAVIDAVVRAMRVACAIYLKPVYCLQRSAVVTRLLRKRGVPAELVIGCHPAPLKAHAWVEVAGDVVSDHQDGLEFYQILDRW